MSSSSLFTLCSYTSSSLHPKSNLSHSVSAKLSSKANVSVQFLRKRQSQSPLLSSTPRLITANAMALPLPKSGGKKKKIFAVIRLTLVAGKATPGPPVGPVLSGNGIKNILGFCKEYNARTADKAGDIIPVEITVYEDKSFTFVLRTPPTSFLLLKAAGVEKGSKDPEQTKVGKITIDQLREIAVKKMPELNCTTIESAMRTIAGTAANMGIDIESRVLEPKKNTLLL